MKNMALGCLVLLLANGCATTTKAPASTAGAGEPLHGTAGWYGQEFAGRTTANGEIFDPLLLTASHRSLPFGTIAEVKNAKTGQAVRVRINDRGPFVGSRLIDLSYAAARQIGLIESGGGEVDLAIVKVGRGDREPPAPYVVEITEPARSPVAAGVARPPAAVKETPVPDGAPPPLSIVPDAIAARPAAAPAAGAVPSVADSVAVVDSAAVIEERHGVDTRRQVAADGKTVESVPLSPQIPGAARDVTAAPGHESAAALDQSRHTNIHPSEEPRVARNVAASRGSGRYVVQVGAFSIEANAKDLQRRLTRIGEPNHIERTNLYRVMLGPFPSRDQALKARTRLEGAGLSALVLGE